MFNVKAFNLFRREFTLGALLIANIIVWAIYFSSGSDGMLRVYFLNVGQGDAILIDSPKHGRVLIDGGRNRQALTELGKILPFGDRRIDVVVATHPDADHINGLVDVVTRYKVGAYIEPGIETAKEVDDLIHNKLEEKSIPKILARRGMVINFGDGAKLTILFPNQDVSKWETNDGSIVAKLVYGDDSFLFTGDSPLRTENILLSLNKEILDSDVLKAGHHGSRTSTSLQYAQAVSPEYAIISAGIDNSYGHPHKEVLNILSQVHSQIFNTAEKGTIKFETDGKKLILK